jgi:hypothetical protein
VTDVNPINATGILISDPSHALPVEINCNGLRMLAFGIGDPQVLSVRYVGCNADVRVGDIVSSSGLGGCCPPDYPGAQIGTGLQLQIGVDPPALTARELLDFFADLIERKARIGLQREARQHAHLIIGAATNNRETIVHRLVAGLLHAAA